MLAAHRISEINKMKSRGRLNLNDLTHSHARHDICKHTGNVPQFSPAQITTSEWIGFGHRNCLLERRSGIDIVEYFINVVFFCDCFTGVRASL